MVGGIHTVDLKTPDVSIIIEVLKSICTMSIVREFQTFKKFNLESIFDSKSNDNNLGVDSNKK
jgi:tRNA acetyltransferase TAN1